MIISVSRRTDIPRYYAGWFIQRIRAGYCLVPNPYNSRQIARIDLRPEAVTALVFWTRDPGPLLPYLDELDARGYRYYFLCTLTGYPQTLERQSLRVPQAIETFIRLSRRIGAGRVIWRYDPIFITDELTPSYHQQNFSNLASALQGTTRKVVISLLSEYRKTLANLARQRIKYAGDPRRHPQIQALVKRLVDIALENGMRTSACSEPLDLSATGIERARCIDNRLLADEFGIDLPYRKDPSQRNECTCMVSRDIGVNNTCPAGCLYCYATLSETAVLKNRSRHSEENAMLVSPETPIDLTGGK